MLITISKNNNVLCKAMPLDVVLKSIGEEMDKQIGETSDGDRYG